MPGSGVRVPHNPHGNLNRDFFNSLLQKKLNMSERLGFYGIHNFDFPKESLSKSI